MIGIGGSGMYPLAQILAAHGYSLTGSDNNPSATLESVGKMGVPIFMGHRPENLGDCELVVYSAAISPDNVELAAARSRGIPTMERSVLLGLIANSYPDTVAVCGTHGKTSTTSMLTEILLKAGKDPSAVIGGKLASIGGSGRVGDSGYMTCEACEFRNTYHTIFPAYALILDVDEDHLEFFGDLSHIIASFAKFASQAKKLVLYNADDPNTVEAVKDVAPAKKCGFGTGETAVFRAVDIAQKGPFYSYRLLAAGEDAGRVELSVPGRFHVFNSLGAIAAAVQCGVSAADAARYASRFCGAGRRFERIGHFDGFTLVDDYAHNPTELTVTLQTARQTDARRVIAVFQPVTFSRTRLMFDELAAALSLADRTILLPILGSREVNTYGVSSEELAAAIPGCLFAADFESAAQLIKENAAEGDLVLTLGCGDVYKVIPYLKQDCKTVS